MTCDKVTLVQSTPVVTEIADAPKTSLVNPGDIVSEACNESLFNYLLNGLVSVYEFDSDDTQSANGVFDVIGSNEGSASGFTVYSPSVDSGFPMKGWYTFDSVATDSSGAGNNLTATDISYVAGKLGDAASFNGTTSRLQDSSFSITGRQTHTLAVWVYVTDLSSQRTIISFGTGYTVNIETDGRVRAEMNSSSITSRRVFSTNTVPINTWTHIVVVETGYSASNQSRTQAEIGIWINGVQEITTTNTITASTADSAVLNVGCYNAASNFFQGYMDDLRIYAYIVSAQDIADIYNSGNGTTNQVLQPAWVPGTVNTWARNIRGGWSSGDSYTLGSASVPAKIALNETVSQTFSFWIYPRSIHGLTPIVPCGMFARGLQGLGFNFQYTSSSVTIQAYARVGGTSTLVSRQVAGVSLDAWHHVVLRYDASGGMLYLHIDNSSDTGASTAAVTAFNITAALRIGREVVSGNQTGTNAYIDELRVYNRLLSTTEVTTLYNKGDVAEGLVLKYDFEEGTGNSINDTYYQVEGINTNYGEAWNFNAPTAAGESVVIPDSASLNTTNLTVAYWCVPYNTDCDIIRKWESTGNQRSWGCGISSSQTFKFVTSPDGTTAGNTSLFSTSTATAGQVYRVVNTYDGTTMKMYVNGVLEDSDVCTGIFQSTSSVRIADSFIQTNDFKGKIAGIFIASRAWGQDEVNIDYNGGAGWDVEWWLNPGCVPTTYINPPDIVSKVCFEPLPETAGFFLLLENDDRLLLESGDALLTEG